ncbi:MAG: nucleotidyltransferase family protein [Cyclobacteriaceae bacterium]|nr:nucleotidyltransferase family protein [Cyclobacteriaceae bacterium]UYN86436.1 MAG: nucleotidyltransferase family protein [Cyclobacteriaceae bacterium]
MIPMQHNAITIIVLAAGSSSRMGQPKQLIQLNGYSLLEHAVRIAKNSRADQVLVVVGSDGEKNIEAINHLAVEVVMNHQWKEGMGSSLKTGLIACLEKFPQTRAIVVLVCDQPRVTTDHLNTLMNTYTQTHSSIVASRYASTVGVPAVFDNFLFQELLNLPNNQGAKNIILNHQTNLVAIDLPGGEIDLDTPDDLRRYREQLKLT